MKFINKERRLYIALWTLFIIVIVIPNIFEIVITSYKIAIYSNVMGYNIDAFNDDWSA